MTFRCKSAAFVFLECFLFRASWKMLTYFQNVAKILFPQWSPFKFQVAVPSLIPVLPRHLLYFSFKTFITSYWKDHIEVSNLVYLIFSVIHSRFQNEKCHGHSLVSHLPFSLLCTDAGNRVIVYPSKSSLRMYKQTEYTVVFS